MNGFLRCAALLVVAVLLEPLLLDLRIALCRLELAALDWRRKRLMRRGFGHDAR